MPSHWLVDREARAIFAYRLEHGLWLELGVFGDEHEARIAPFADVPLDIARWWG